MPPLKNLPRANAGSGEFEPGTREILFSFTRFYDDRTEAGPLVGA